MRASTSGTLRVDNTSFDDCSVGYSAEPICLTLTMVQKAGMGWLGAEFFVFKADDYHGSVRYGCPRTCDLGDGYGADSCDNQDDFHGTNPSTCDANGVNLAASGCHCQRCKCSGWDPPESSYLHRTSLQDVYSASEQICFERDFGKGEYVILVTDDKYPAVVQWSLEGEGYVIDGGAHDLQHLDFTTLEAEDCETPGRRARDRPAATPLTAHHSPPQVEPESTSRTALAPSSTTRPSAAPQSPMATEALWSSRPTSPR